MWTLFPITIQQHYAQWLYKFGCNSTRLFVTERLTAGCSGASRLSRCNCGRSGHLQQQQSKGAASVAAAAATSVRHGKLMLTPATAMWAAARRQSAAAAALLNVQSLYIATAWTHNYDIGLFIQTRGKFNYYFLTSLVFNHVMLHTAKCRLCLHNDILYTALSSLTKLYHDVVVG